jgi:hypothetical protein
MPRPTHPDRYPVSFPQAIAHTIRTAPTPFVIPTEAPVALRSQFYGYFRALRLHGDDALANSIAIYINPDSIELRTRDSTPAACAVSAALAAATSRDNPRDPQPFDLESPEQSNIPSA